MESIVITGATSMLGVSLVRAALAGTGIRKIYAVVRENTAKADRLPDDERIELVRCDIGQYAGLHKIIKKADAFFHLAWKLTGKQRNTDIYGQAENIKFALDALSSAKEMGCGKFICTGSQAEYGDTDAVKISPYTAAEPADAYGIAKFCAGKLARLEAKKLGMDCFWVRVFSVYGEYDLPTTMVSSTVAALMRGESPEFTPAENIWDFLYSDDAGKALLMIGQKAKGNKVYCLGSGEGKPLKEYIETIGKTVNPDITLKIGAAAYPGGRCRNICADISELAKDTGWKPEIRFEEGIRRVHGFFKDKGIQR